MRSCKKLRNVFYITFITAVSLILFNVYIVFPSFHEELIRETETDSTLIAEHLSSIVFTEDEVIRPSEEFAAEFLQAQNDFDIKIARVYSADGMIIYSTDTSDIGMVSRDAYFSEYVSKGRTYSKMVKKDAETAEGDISNIDVVETYVPVMLRGNFIGAIEIYHDITDRIASLNLIIFRLTICSFILVIAFFILTTVSIIRSNENDMDLKDIPTIDFFRNPYRLLLSIFIIVFTFEFGIMFLLPKFYSDNTLLALRVRVWVNSYFLEHGCKNFQTEILFIS